MNTLPGFSSPVDDAQTVFRAALAALSRPGLPVELAGLPPAAPGLSTGMAALALALCDNDTPVWLDAGADTPDARRHLRFHCACPIADAPEKALFACIARPGSMPRLSAFHQGLPAYPDRSATLLIKAGLHANRGGGDVLRAVSGPGVRGGKLPFAVSGLPAWFWDDWAENNASYPLGVDVILVDDEKTPALLLGLPRSVSVSGTAAKEAAPCM